ncbi:MAG TPA: hypothetical protein VME22_08640 [Solirubrobacteraceae bacterium]|nr:hypothetical protein [Solirubrobacteraceae bacterium]
MPASHDNTHPRGTPVAVRLLRVSLVMFGIAAAVVAAVASGAISLPGSRSGAKSQASSEAALAAQREAANSHWATATCTNILDWKNEIQRDGTSLDLGLGPSARIEDAISATRRMLTELEKLGLPPAAQNAQARAQIEQLRSDLQSRLQAIEGTADSVASGNLLAIGTLLGDLASDRTVGTQIAGELRQVVSVDLGLSLVETRACRQLVGIPV